MRIVVRYQAQVRHAAGVAVDEVQVEGACSLQDLIRYLVERRGNSLRKILLGPAGGFQPSILYFVGDQHATLDQPVALKDGDVVTVLSPIAGG